MKLLSALLSLCIGMANAQSPAAGPFSEKNLAYLMKHFAKGVAAPTPWVGYWWPYEESGIASHEYYVAGESPAEKADRAQGNGDRIAAWENAHHGPGRQGRADWWGHCNGWAVASLMETEPRETVKAGGEDFSIGSRKAILTEYWLEAGSDVIGTRVYDDDDFESDAFWDVIPAHFHLALTNVMGRQKHAVIVDRYTGAQVWNQPLVAYEIAPIRREDDLGPDPDGRGLYRVNVTATMWWARADVDPDDVTPEFQWKENWAFSSRTLRYELWVDAPLKFDANGNLIRSGDIVITEDGKGGQWKNGTSRAVLVNSHPDFIWIPLSYAASTGYKNPRLNDEWVHGNLRTRVQ